MTSFWVLRAVKHFPTDLMPTESVASQAIAEIVVDLMQKEGHALEAAMQGEGGT